MPHFAIDRSSMKQMFGFSVELVVATCLLALVGNDCLAQGYSLDGDGTYDLPFVATWPSEDRVVVFGETYTESTDVVDSNGTEIEKKEFTWKGKNTETIAGETHGTAKFNMSGKVVKADGQLIDVQINCVIVPYSSNATRNPIEYRIRLETEFHEFPQVVSRRRGKFLQLGPWRSIVPYRKKKPNRALLMKGVEFDEYLAHDDEDGDSAQPSSMTGKLYELDKSLGPSLTQKIVQINDGTSEWHKRKHEELVTEFLLDEPPYIYFEMEYDYSNDDGDSDDGEEGDESDEP